MFLKILILILLFLGGIFPLKAWAEPGVIFIDPQDTTVIWQTEVPFTSQVLLSSSDLPSASPLHEGVVFGRQKFSHIALSPDRSRVAFSVDGTVHDWSGIYDLENKNIREITFCFEGEVKEPFWSNGGRYIAVEEKISFHRRYLEIVDLESDSRCRLDGRRVRNKYLNFSDPWWNSMGDKIYFKVDYNNVYRKSLGLKTKKFSQRIGEAGPDCKKVVFYSVSDFMKKFPTEAQDYGLPLRKESP